MSIYLLCATLLGVFTKAVSFKPHGSSGNGGNNEELGTQKDRVGWLASGLGEATLGSWRGVFGGDPDQSQHLLLSEVLPQAPRG